MFPYIAHLFADSNDLLDIGGKSKHLRDEGPGVTVKEKMDTMVLIQRLVLPVLIAEFEKGASSATKSDSLVQL